MGWLAGMCGSSNGGASRTAELPGRLSPWSYSVHDMVVVPILDAEGEDEVQVNLQSFAACESRTGAMSACYCGRGQGPLRQF
jgi:hypothetical protein